MTPLAPLLAFLLAVTGRKHVYWLIDGNNFLGQRGTGLPKNGQVLLDRLRPVSTTAAQEIILVFDGRRGESRQDVIVDNRAVNGDGDDDDNENKNNINNNNNNNAVTLREVHLEEGGIADNFILEEIQRISQSSKSNRVKLVTADKALRAQALQTRPTVKTVVNPRTFWKTYLPRMSGQKKRAFVPEEEDDESVYKEYGSRMHDSESYK